jgi:protein-disulfide isomerase
VALVALNRILIVLGFVGLFVAGFLSLSHLLDISLPCGITKGCDIVTTHPSSFLFGNKESGFPVAYLGFIGYLFLTIIAIVRSSIGLEKSRSLIVVGFLASAVGALYSGYLTYTSLYVIHEVCRWCLGSAITMIVTTIVYAAMLQADTPSESPQSKVDLLLAGALTLVVGISLGVGSYQLKAGGQVIDRVSEHRINSGGISLVTKDSHILGNADAPVTIIEFADLLCPTCQKTFPVLEDLVKNSNGKVRLVFHHYPLFMKPDHKMALPAATMAEIAADESKFWQFIAQVYSKQHADLQTTEALLAVAKSVGLDVDKVQKRMADADDPAIKRVTDDLNLANEIKITGTPTLFIQAKGGKIEGVTNSELEAKLNQEPYISLIKGAAPGQ